MKHYRLILADCPFTLKRKPERWLVAPASAYRSDLRHFEYHVNIDTDGIEYRMFRKTTKVREDFQESQRLNEGDLVRFREQSGCDLAAGASKQPAFYLVLQAEKTS